MMRHQTDLDPQPIDAVITWVDGSAPEHRKKRDAYMGQSNVPLHENAINPHRWESNDEILFCLQSIANFAPWIRKVWIVVDDETPDLSQVSDDILSKVEFAFHRDIFAGHDYALPTFNSLAIESMLWRIEGLSECFLYFNDDVFLSAPLEPTDVFEGNLPVLRGRWVNYSGLIEDADAQKDPALFNHFMQANAAELCGFEADDLYSAAHVVHPLRRSIMEELFERFPEQFANNIKHRFRDISQFLPQGLHNHACISSGAAVLNMSGDHLHIKSGQGNDRAPIETWKLLQDANKSGIKFLCVNDLPQLEALIPQARVWLGEAIGGFDASPSR